VKTVRDREAMILWPYQIINLIFTIMKKKLLLAGAAMLLAAAAVTGFSAYNKTNVPDLLSANVEALAQNEGTNVSTCYFKSFYGDVGGYAECDDRTSTSTIYPCPDRTSYFSASSSSMCTN
jgi:hypothetical protein